MSQKEEKLIFEKDKKRGFTLIELLISLVIISIILGIVVVNFDTVRMNARNNQRISDLRQIQLALEQYYDDHKEYPTCLPTPPNPVPAACESPTSFCICLGTYQSNFGKMDDLAGLLPYVHKIPQDPINSSGQLGYDYVYARGFRKETDVKWVKTDLLSDYILIGRLELASDASMPTIWGEYSGLNNIRSQRKILLGNE